MRRRPLWTSSPVLTVLARSRLGGRHHLMAAALGLSLSLAGCSSDPSASGGNGGSNASGGVKSSGGHVGSGGATSAGGTSAGLGGSNGGSPSGGASGLGGVTASGGIAASGGRAASGGTTTGTGGSASGGAGPTGGAAGGMAGGTGGNRPDAAADGQPGGGGSTGAGGATGTGGTSVGPCDIYETAGTSCVAAHSTVRALYGAYNGPIYQLRRASDKTTKDVPPLAPGGFVDISVQDAFCKSTTCTISIIYDQSPNKNDLIKSGVAHWLPNGGVEANASQGQITVGGHTVHGIYVTSGSNVAYRNNATKGVAKANGAEAMYMVVDGKRYSDQCCFDYGNAETSGNDDGNGTMEAVYFGNDITWGGKGDGNGPWVAADLENGVFKCDKGGWQSQSLSVPNAKSIVANYVTVMLKGPAANTFAIKGGSAQTGTLTTMWNGARPSSGYYPKKLQGAIILGTGGDGSNTGTGTFFEGAMTNGTPPDSVDDAIQANIVAAGYGR